MGSSCLSKALTDVKRSLLTQRSVFSPVFRRQHWSGSKIITLNNSLRACWQKHPAIPYHDCRSTSNAAMAGVPQRTKIICLGLGRTGTYSLMLALKQLGYDPVYHMSTIMRKKDPAEFEKWRRLTTEPATSNDIRALLDDYAAILDYPAIMFPELLYETYPDAKYILTTRDPASWEKSVKSTLLRIKDQWKAAPYIPPLQQAIQGFQNEIINDWYHGGRLGEPQELIKHNDRVKGIIPLEKLLVYEASQGWDPLVEFLGVEKPSDPFPSVNDTASFQQMMHRIIDSLPPEPS
ncbi:hypothetical protein M422DRAFT_205687 [Sphaerobolus stellatus SS14]|uniref:Protein-tyrosine sulfotransferase n=1 Tax=Sphaerobolus stellatus (strain SS14) TaxID=990650 RepID=A0A0C9W4Y7_SPHS4|nr:hypothetical protein M422DRAFT_205687 [Sphaerobolus stellatus SS14]